MQTRKSLIIFILACFLTTCLNGNSFACEKNKHAEKIKPSEAKRLLVEGNTRFVSGKPIHPRQDAALRKEIINGQHPCAIILGCADSRISPEILFDQGLGDLFVVREAGNVIDDHTIGGIEYAVEHFQVSLIVVLGHENCGAIAAARDTAVAEGHLKSLVASILPAVEATRGQDAESTCKANIRNIVFALQTSEPLLKHLVAKGELVVLGAYYNIGSGVITYFNEK